MQNAKTSMFVPVLGYKAVKNGEWYICHGLTANGPITFWSQQQPDSNSVACLTPYKVGDLRWDGTTWEQDGYSLEYFSTANTITSAKTALDAIAGMSF